MGVQIILYDPSGTAYDVTAGSGHDVRAESLPELNLSLRNGDAEIESGDLDLTFKNLDGWYDSRWMQPDPEQFFSEATGSGCWSLALRKNGVLRWVGDLDAHSPTFDTEARSVSATFLGRLKRLERFNAELVRRPIPQYSDAGSGWSLVWGRYRVTLTNTYRTDAFVNHRFVDSAGDVMTISASTASSGHSVDLTLTGGTPAAGAFNIRPMVWTTDRSVSQRILTVRANKDATDGPTIAALGLEVGDEISYTKLMYSGKVKQQRLAIQQVGPHASTGTGDPTLTAHQVQLKTRLQVELNQHCSSLCATPYYRNKPPRDLAVLLFEHCGIGPALREIDIPASASGASTAVGAGYLQDASPDTPITADDQFNNRWLVDALGNRFKVKDTLLSLKRFVVEGTPAAGAYEVHPMVCEYADMEGKTVGAALKELCDDASAILFATPEKYHLLGVGRSKAGTTPKDIDALALKGESVRALSDESVSLVRVTGPEENVYAQRGALLFPEATLEVQTDFLTSRGTMEQIAALKWAQECRRKRVATFPLLDDGTAYQIWDEVVRTVAGAPVTFQVTAVREPLLAVDSEVRTTVEIEAVEKVGLPYATADGAVGAEAVDRSPPPPPTILAVTRTYSAAFESLYPKKDYPRWFPGVEVVDKSPLTVNTFKRWLWEIRFSWDFDDLGGNLLGFQLTKRWDGSNPDKPVGQAAWMDPQQHSDGSFYWPPDEGDGDGGAMYVRGSRKVWFSVRAVYEDGRISAPSDEVATVIGEEAMDGPPAPALGTVTSYKRDRKGTARVECDLTVPAIHTPCDEVEFSFRDPEGVTTKKSGVPSSAGYVEMSCEDSGVRGGLYDDVTFPSAHGWPTNQQVVYTASAGHGIGGLVSGATYWVIAASPTSIQFKPSQVGTKIDLTPPTGGDRHYFTPRLTTTAYFKGLTRGDALSDIKARCIAGGKPGAWCPPVTKVAGADSTAIATPGAPTVEVLRRHRTKLKLRVTLNASDTAATKQSSAAVEVFTAPRWSPANPEPADESSVWEREPDWDIAKAAAAGKTKWKGWIFREEEDPSDIWKPALAARVRNYLDATSEYTFVDVGLAVDLQISYGSDLMITAEAVASGGTAPYANFRFSWGDGTVEDFPTGAGRQHTYPEAGPYTILVGVTDSAGTQASGSLLISVGGIFTPDGEVFCGAGATEARSASLNPPGTTPQTAWLNPAYIQADDANYATCSVPARQYSQSLRATSFGVSVPAGPTTSIKGVRVVVNRMCAAASKVRDAWVQLTYNGSPIGVPMPADEYWPTALASKSYGGPAVRWGASLTAAMVNGASFGVLLGVFNEDPSAARLCSVDYVKVNVYYDTGM